MTTKNKLLFLFLLLVVVELLLLLAQSFRMSAIISPNFPLRISIMTFNTWGDNLWPQRKSSVQQLFASTRSDVIMLQEATADILSTIQEVLPSHVRVTDSTIAYPRLAEKCGVHILWNNELLELVDKDYFDLEIPDYPDRMLFWVRLRVRSAPEKLLFVSTVHLPWCGCERELTSGVNQRIPATTRICECLRSVMSVDGANILGGDFNDDYHPLRILSDEIGMIDVFESLDLVAPITHPARPSAPEEVSIILN